MELSAKTVKEALEKYRSKVVQEVVLVLHADEDFEVYKRHFSLMKAAK